MASPLVLYDLKGRDRSSCFSPNVWKTRAALNFKGIAYETKWIEFPDIAPIWKTMGIPPNPPSDCLFEYSCPTVQMPDGSFIMESRKIATALETLQPLPSLHLETTYPQRAQNAVDNLLFSLGPGIMYRIPEKFLDARGAEWYHEARKEITGGIPILDFADKFSWNDAENSLADIRELLSENPDGPFVMGKQASYADFIIVALWVLFSKVDEGDLIDKILAFDTSFGKHWEACGGWFERDDH